MKSRIDNKFEVKSLIHLYNELGLEERKERLSEDANNKDIESKVTNPSILSEIGMPDRLIEACYHVEFAANKLDCFAEYGNKS